MGDLALLRAVTTGDTKTFEVMVARGRNISIGAYYLAGLYATEEILSFMRWGGIFGATFISVGAAVAGNSRLFATALPDADIDQVHWLAGAAGGNIEILRMLVRTGVRIRDLDLLLMTMAYHGHGNTLRQFIRLAGITTAPYIELMAADWNAFLGASRYQGLPARYAVFSRTPEDVLRMGIMRIVAVSPF